MAGQKTISSTFVQQPEPPPPPPVPLYTATGSTFPGIDGDYCLSGTYGGKSCYAKNISDSFLWWDIILARWILSTLLGDPGTGYFAKQNDPITGSYYHQGIAIGNVTVTDYV